YVDFLTIGQYLQPTRKHHPVVRFVPPDEFKAYETIAYAKGFLMVSSSPLTRSSHHAGEDFARLKAARDSKLARLSPIDAPRDGRGLRRRGQDDVGAEPRRTVAAALDPSRFSFLARRLAVARQQGLAGTGHRACGSARVDNGRELFQHLRCSNA